MPVRILVGMGRGGSEQTGKGSIDPQTLLYGGPNRDDYSEELRDISDGEEEAGGERLDLDDLDRVVLKGSRPDPSDELEKEQLEAERAELDQIWSQVKRLENQWRVYRQNALQAKAQLDADDSDERIFELRHEMRQLDSFAGDLERQREKYRQASVKSFKRGALVAGLGAAAATLVLGPVGLFALPAIGFLSLSRAQRLYRKARSYGLPSSPYQENRQQFEQCQEQEKELIGHREEIAEEADTWGRMAQTTGSELSRLEDGYRNRRNRLKKEEKELKS